MSSHEITTEGLLKISNLALFDFDNTITTNDNFKSFIYFSVSRWRLLFGQVLLAPILIGYKLGFIRATHVRSSIAKMAFCGRSATDVAKLGLKYSADHLHKHIRPEAIERIRWHQNHGDKVVVVSASLSTYLTDWCGRNNLDLICTELETRNNILTGGYLIGDCTGAEKLRRVREKYPIENYSTIYAYGDSDEDREMLSIAHKKIYRWKEVEAHPSESISRS